MHKFSYYILFLFALSCVEDFETETTDFQRILVIDGGISNEVKRHQVTLSYTFPLDSDQRETLSGAEVFVQDSQSNRVIFTESRDGVYESPENFGGQVGESYQLFINTSDGQSYQSTSQVLIASAPIENVTSRFVEIPIQDSNEIESGIQFFVNSQDASADAQFFRYEWEETYQSIVPFPSRFFYDLEDSVVVERPDTVGICYISDQSIELIIANSLNNAENRISDFPIQFVSINTDALKDRYSLLVRQFAISREAHNFYSSLKSLNVSGGSLFDQQVGNISGNVSSIQNAFEPVLGYFEVAGVTELRTFFNPRDFDPPFIRPQFRFDCPQTELEAVPNEELPALFRSFNGMRMRIFGPADLARSAWLVGSADCTDCTSYGSPVEPEFWIN